MNRYPYPIRIQIALLATALVILVPRGTWADPVDDHIAAQTDKVDASVATRMKSGHIPGLSLAVIHNGNPVLVRHYGLANVEWSVPTAPDTVYEIGSITKQFTATTGRQDLSKRQVIDLVARSPLEFAPGTKWSYSNTGYFLLGMLIEQTTGKSYAAFLAERILQPLQMTNTRVNDFRDVIVKRAAGYTWEQSRLRNGEYHSPTLPYAAGAIVSTVEDMAKWDAALSTEKLLKRSSLEQMWTPMKLSNGKSTEYGFGWVVTNYQKPDAFVHHGSGIPGFTTYIARYLGTGITVVVFTNAETDPYAVLDGVYRIVSHDLPQPSP
jgi:D-alanyl-D-alanine carboxypeptidase